MSELNPENAAHILAACNAGAEEAAGALGRALGGEFTLSAGEVGAFDASAAPAGFDGAGLVVLLQLGERGIALVMPAASGMVPEWCAAPDASGESRLATLAQELSVLFLPESLSTSDFQARRVEGIAAALERAQVAPNATLLPLAVKSGDKSEQLSLIWPLEAPGELFDAPAITAPGAESVAAKSASQESPKNGSADSLDLSTLPNYSRSLLKIRVRVSVQLAGKKESVQEVITLAPGSIIKFDKGCEELLQMIVGEHTVAEGEAVKIGEKFGFRVTSMKMPPEHFVPVKKPRRA